MGSKAKLIVSLISGILAAVLGFLYLQAAKQDIYSDQMQNGGYGERSVTVYVAEHNLFPGEILSEEDFEDKVWDTNLLPEGVVQAREDLIGKSLLVSVAENTPLTKHHVEEAVLLEVPSEKVALSVSSANVRSVGGSLRPGMQVDVYSNIEQVSLLAHGVEVLQTSKQTDSYQSKTNKDISWITLAVDPELVEAFIAAEASKTLYFSLPGEKDE